MNSDLLTYYARRAKEYEQVYRKPERQEEIRYLTHYLSQAFQDQSVIEIACGTGYWTQYIAQTARSVVATDVSPEVLEVAKTKDIPRQNVTFRLANLYRLPKPDHPFNAGFGGFIRSHIPRSQLIDFLESFHRPMMKGSKVIFIDNRYVAGSSTSLHSKDDEGNTFQKRQLGNGEEYVVLKNFPSETELRDTLQHHAIDIQITWLTYFWILTYRTA